MDEASPSSSSKHWAPLPLSTTLSDRTTAARMTTVSRPENSPQNPSVALDEPGFSIIGASSQSPASASAAVSPEPVVAISSADWHKDGEVPANGTPAAANEDDKRDHALEEGFRVSRCRSRVKRGRRLFGLPWTRPARKGTRHRACSSLRLGSLALHRCPSQQDTDTCDGSRA